MKENERNLGAKDWFENSEHGIVEVKFIKNETEANAK